MAYKCASVECLNSTQVQSGRIVVDACRCYMYEAWSMRHTPDLLASEHYVLTAAGTRDAGHARS